MVLGRPTSPFRLLLHRQHAIIISLLSEQVANQIPSSPSDFITDLLYACYFANFVVSDALSVSFRQRLILKKWLYGSRKVFVPGKPRQNQSCFINIILISREVPFIQEISGVYTFYFLHRLTKTGFTVPKCVRGFQKRAQGVHWKEGAISNHYFNLHTNLKLEFFFLPMGK